MACTSDEGGADTGVDNGATTTGEALADGEG